MKLTMSRRVVLVVSSALLAVAVFPPLGWQCLAVIAWIPLLLALQGVKPSHALYLGILHGALFYGATMSWLFNVFVESPVFVVPLVLILALFTGFFARGFSYVYLSYAGGESGRRAASWSLPFFAASWWVAVEYFRCEIFILKFPWMSPGLGLGPMWISPILGVYGISFCLLLFSSMLCQSGKLRLVGGLGLSMMLVSSLAHSDLMGRGDLLPDAPVKVAAVQSELCYWERYAELTAATTSDLDLIVWPEYGISRDIRQDKKSWEAIQKISQERDAVLVIGTQTKFGKGAKDWFNTALTLEAGELKGEHYKNHTVHFFNDGTSGVKAEATKTDLARLGTPICFDCDYEDVVRKMVADGAEFLAVPSMDAEHWSDREHHQHAELFRHRAAENGRWIVVSSTSGVTQIIAPSGLRVAALPLLDDGVLVGEIGRRQGMTFYTRIGWLFPGLMSCIGLLWLLVIFIGQRRCHPG